MEDHRRKSPGPSQMTQNSDGLEVHTLGLKHLQVSIKLLQHRALDTGYEMGILTARLDKLRNLQDSRVTLDRVAMVDK
jgi:hypothetical protein